ncbi:hypothetical protein NDU88_002477 [Pleurodeles waltl]|uniref:Secreted protein n=1 Tax=Pleurodeles waltl TaxID=8319 RepID=A0AAV7WPL5_PLEWA|nr:hypothetical protein NDU88_002477 [Pleurodeles waltl]
MARANVLSGVFIRFVKAVFIHFCYWSGGYVAKIGIHGGVRHLFVLNNDSSSTWRENSSRGKRLALADCQNRDPGYNRKEAESPGTTMSSLHFRHNLGHVAATGPRLARLQ